MVGIARDPLERFWSRVDIRGDDECWPWLAGTASKGYGQFFIAKGAPIGAHRFSWELANRRPIPPGLVVMHSCDNPPCVNPAHLSIGTHADNRRDSSEKGRNPGNRTNRGRIKSRLDADHVVALRRQGLTYKQIANLVGVRPSTVWRRVNREAA